MLWWFERNGAQTMIEVLNLPTGDYELRIIEADGVERVERFGSAADLARRQQAVHDSLIAQGWSRSGDWLL